MMIERYRQTAEAPWGRLFYRILHAQIDEQLAIAGVSRSGGDAGGSDKELPSILDFGSGFGITAERFSGMSRLTAIEPDERLSAGGKERNYQLISASQNALAELDSSSFDVVFCHNVLEYVEDAAAIVAQFRRVLKPSGMLSLVVHNRPGKVLSLAIIEKSPLKAMAMLDEEEAGESDLFGKIRYRSREAIEGFISGSGFFIASVYGIRTCFGLVADNEIKYESEWQESTFSLEMVLGGDPRFMGISFWNHYIIRGPGRR